MANGQLNTVVTHLRRAVLLRDGAGMTDGQLVDSFLNERDEAAFEVLVRRHGPMVLGVWRRVLHHVHDAEDVFQATFLVLCAGRLPSRTRSWSATGSTGPLSAPRWKRKRRGGG